MSDQEPHDQDDDQDGAAPLIWTVHVDPEHYSARYVAIPAAPDHTSRKLPVALMSDTLDGLRAMLPPGLTRLERHPLDDATVVESWR